MYKRKDYYYLKAKEEGFLSRAAYKLQEIVDSYRIIRKNDRVIDIGCSPGGWSQVATKIVGEGGLVIGIDLVEPEVIPVNNFIFVKGNINDESIQNSVLALLDGKADTVISDASPKLSGIREKDHFLSLEIIESVYNFSKKCLKPHGNMLIKMIEGPNIKEIFEKIQSSFTFAKIFRPDSTRKSSRENYIIAKGFIN